VLHLWHPDADRARLFENERRLACVIESGRVRAERGISTLDTDAEIPSSAQGGPESGGHRAVMYLRS
jgi:hypothetical protein